MLAMRKIDFLQKKSGRTPLFLRGFKTIPLPIGIMTSKFTFVTCSKNKL